MKRNTISVLKYLILAALILTTGPLLIKILLGEDSLIKGRSRHEMFHAQARGAGPVDPDVIDRIFDSNDWDMNPKIDHPKFRQTPIPNSYDKTFFQENKIDWHNYSLIEADKKRKGPGEQGLAYIVKGKHKEEEDLYAVNGFNAYISDQIALDRAIPDIRHSDCRSKKYIPKMLNASIIVPFHNEHFTTLIRSALSVINRSPSQLLHEIILVDDFSSKESLKKDLDDYIKKHFKKVKVVRQAKREGLIRTRLAGAKVATGEVLIFLDSHVEANVNWLPPLLEPITQNYKTVVCPFIDVIDYNNFQYRAQDEGARGAFDWEFFYKRLPLLNRDLLQPAEPFNSPVMAGGLFAISTKWFWELGGYDPGLDIWGGEQYELSFKIWQCGGKMVDAPCSRVGHIYRKFAPFPNPGVGDFIARNYKRVAEVWMDEYKEFIYARRPHYKNVDAGDISEQLAVREKLKCKPFKWFMTKVAFDLVKKYPTVVPKDSVHGRARNEATKLCIEIKDKDIITSGVCNPLDHARPAEQLMQMTWKNDLKPTRIKQCFDVPSSTNRSPINLYACHGLKGNQWFKYNRSKKQLYHPISNQCIDMDLGGGPLFMSNCDENKATQRWHWDHMEIDLVDKKWLVQKDEDQFGDNPPDSDL